MQSIVFDKPYVFVPPYRGRIWPRLLLNLVRWQLRRAYGVTQVTCRGTEQLRQSRAAGHGILLAPNHCRPADPFAVAEMARQLGMLPYTMASWHIFMQGRVQSWALHRGGVFSIYREGADRAAINAAIDILSAGDRPLVIFPEGVVNRANDRLSPFMDGVSLIARAAAKKRAALASPSQVVVHPIALRYTFAGDQPTLEKTVSPTLDELERRLSWAPQSGLTLRARIEKLGHALLALKEMEYLGAVQSGDLAERIGRLITHLLAPLEAEWVQGKSDGTVVTRVKRLRTAILPGMVQGDITEEERERRWKQLADVYLAQQLSFYPSDYIASRPTADRMLETLERIEEDLTDDCRPYPPIHVTVSVGAAIPVNPQRERGAAEDPLTAAMEASIRSLLGIAP